MLCGVAVQVHAALAGLVWATIQISAVIWTGPSSVWSHYCPADVRIQTRQNSCLCDQCLPEFSVQAFTSVAQVRDMVAFASILLERPGQRGASWPRDRL